MLRNALCARSGIYGTESLPGRDKAAEKLTGDNRNNNRDAKPARPDEIRKRTEARKPDEEGGRLSRPLLEPDFPLPEGRKLHDRQQPGGTVHPAFGERAEELAVLRQRQDGACQRGLPLHRVHMQAAGVLHPGISQEVLCRNSRRQLRLRKTYALDHRHKCKQTININSILILFQTFRL